MADDTSKDNVGLNTDTLRDEMQNIPSQETDTNTNEETPETPTPSQGDDIIPAEGGETPQEGEQDDKTPEPFDETGIPEKFHGKSRAEITRAYLELEKLKDERTIGSNEREIMKDNNIKRADIPDDKDLEAAINQIDFQNIHPVDFVKQIIAITDKRANERAEGIYKASDEARRTVRNEVAEFKKEYPELSSNEDAKEMIVSFIESAQARGKKMTLAEAAEKVTKILGIEKMKEQTIKSEENRKGAQVEKDRNAGGDNTSDEDKELERMLGSKPYDDGFLGV